MVEVVTIETQGLGDRSYLAHDGQLAVVIDPQRDIDRVLDAARAAGVEVACVAETHIHNDYVSGGLALARATGADYLVAGADQVGFERRPVGDGDVVAVGTFSILAMATPGHTDHHLAYVLRADDGRHQAVFTGGSLLFGTVGRTDLVAPELTDGLTRAQYRSGRRLGAELAAEVEVLPTHGFGSFCSSGGGSGASRSTIGDQRRGNPALTGDDEGSFVEALLGGLTDYPGYYAHMGPRNRAGAEAADLSPPEVVGSGELSRRIEAGEWVVDLRSRRAFAGGHVQGTVGVELSDPFATYLGWVMPWGTPVTLVGSDQGQVADAQRALARIGVDRPAGAAVGRPDQLAAGRALRSYRVSDFAGLVRAGRGAGSSGPAVLDVRRDDEWREGHLAGAVHVPLQELVDRMEEVPQPSGQPVWVHCASGFRASIAASLLDRAGRAVVLIDDDWTEVARSGLETTAGSALPAGH